VNPKQKGVVWIGALSIIAMGMYPPWIQVSLGVQRQYAYGWIFSPPAVMIYQKPEEAMTPQVDFSQYDLAPRTEKPPQLTAPPAATSGRPPLVNPWATVKDPTATGTAAPDTSWIKRDFMTAAKPAPAPTGRPPLVYPWGKPVSHPDPLWRTELDVTRLALQWAMLGVFMGACYVVWPGPAIQGVVRFLYRR
jgi:hypothetical protein